MRQFPFCAGRATERRGSKTASRSGAPPACRSNKKALSRPRRRPALAEPNSIGRLQMEQRSEFDRLQVQLLRVEPERFYRKVYPRECVGRLAKLDRRWSMQSSENPL